MADGATRDGSRTPGVEGQAEQLSALVKAIGDTAPNLIYAKDREGRIIYANPATIEVIGRPAEQVLGRRESEWASDPEEARAIAEVDARVMASGGQEIIDELFTSPTGEKRVFRTAKTALRDTSGAIVGVVGVSTDVTSLRRSEEALRSSEERMLFGLDAARMVAWDFDLRTGTGRRSANAMALFGLKSEGANDFYDLVHPDDLDRLRAVQARAVAGEADYDAEFRLNHPGGRTLWVAVRGRLQRDASGRPVTMAGVLMDITARKEAELAAQRSAAEFEALAENVSQLAWMAEPDGHIFWYNRRWYEFTGATPDEMRGWGWRKAHHPDHVERVTAKWREHLARGERWEDTFPLRGADGRYRWFLSRAEPIRDQTGAIARWFGTNTDVTEQRETAEALARSEAWFRTVSDALPGMVFVATPEGGNVQVNELFRVYAGRTNDELMGDGWLDVLHPDDRERAGQIWQGAVRAQTVYMAEYRFRRRDGDYRWHIVRGLPVRDPQGRVTHWLGVCLDIHDRRIAEEELRRSEAQFRATAEALPGMLFVATDQDGNLYVNEEYRRYTGRADKDLLGFRSFELFHPDDRERMREAWNHAVRTGELYQGEFRMRRHDGAFRWHLVRGLPIRDDDGGIDRWVGACVDIHERIEAEQELQRRVEEAIAEREKVLLQLHEAQKLETVGQLTGGVAHDFNNLLTPIVGSLDLVRRRLDDERSIRLVDGALASAERARTLIQRLLAFARRQTLQPRAVDPGAMAESMRELIEGSLGPRIAFFAEIEPDVPPALVDQNQLELALLNLSINARDAMPNGGQLIWRIAEEAVDGPHPELGPGRYVRIAVSDTGTGMDADTLARAVEPFFSTKPAGKGTGLGLSMVHGLAGQSGGGFRLESAPGAGTTATLWLPVAEQAVVVEARHSETHTASRRAKVLLVDDEEQVRLTTSESLAELGYDVVPAGSAQEALDQIAAGLQPDLLVTDHLMPGMTGVQLAMELRRRLPNLPVLMITGYAQLRPEELGDFDVLVKPYRHAELALRVADLLSEVPVLQRALS